AHRRGCRLDVGAALRAAVDAAHGSGCPLGRGDVSAARPAVGASRAAAPDRLDTVGPPTGAGRAAANRLDAMARERMEMKKKRFRRNKRPDIGVLCPRCGSDQTTHPPKNFSWPLDTERGW